MQSLKYSDIVGKAQDKQKDRQNSWRSSGNGSGVLKETKKRQSKQCDASESWGSGRKRRNTESEAMTYLREKEEIEFEVRKDEMKMKQQEIQERREMWQQENKTQLAIAENSKNAWNFQQLNLQQQLLQQQQQDLFFRFQIYLP